MTQVQDQERLQQAGATFLYYYYGMLSTQPARLAQFYAPDAVLEHQGQRATGDGIAGALAQLYHDPKHAPTHVKVDELRVEGTGPQFDLHVRGIFHLQSDDNDHFNFQHSLNMIEHAPNTFGVSNDRLSSIHTVSPPPKLDSWADETPPMFATKVEEKIPPLEDIPPPMQKAPVVEAPEAVKKNMTMAERIRATQPPPKRAAPVVTDASEPVSEPKPNSRHAANDSPSSRNGPPPYKVYDLFVRGYPDKASRSQLLSALNLELDMINDVKLVSRHETENGIRGPYAFIQFKERLATKDKIVSALIQSTLNTPNATFPELEVNSVRAFSKPHGQGERRSSGRKGDDNQQAASRRRAGHKHNEADGFPSTASV